MTHDGKYEAAPEGVAADELISFIERAERMNEEVASIGEAKKDLFVEIKSRGFCGKTIKAIIKRRAEDPAERAEREAVLDLYLTAIGDR